MTAAARVEEALEYRERGWAVLPLKPREKIPHAAVLREVHGAAKWKPLAERPASEPEIRAWFERDPETQIGIITGQASGGLVVIDQDKKVPGLKHPPGPIVETGRGRHLYAEFDQPIKTTTHDWGEVRGDGSYVVAPSAIHPSGRSYLWLVRPDDCAPPSLRDVEFDGEPIGTTHDRSPKAVPYGTALGDSEGIHHPRLLAALGIHAPVGRAFRCVLPGHADRSPSASIDPATGRYHDFHRAGAWFSLAEVYASRKAGGIVRLDGPSASRWWDRLRWEAGELAVVVPAPPRLSPATPARTVRVVEGFVLLVALRELRDGPGPVPYTRRFITAWCGLSEHHAEQAKLDALRRGALVKDGEFRRGGQRTALYRIVTRPA